MMPISFQKRKQLEQHVSDDQFSSTCEIQSKASSHTSKSGTFLDEAEQRAYSDASMGRNRCVSWFILAISICGLSCAIFSTLSCKWFAWTPLEDDHAWGVYSVDRVANQAESVGLFRYDSGSHSNIRSTESMFQSCKAYSYASGNDKWGPLVLRKLDPWMFTSQLCWLMAFVVAILAFLATVARICQPCVGRASCCASSGWLLASGLQAASCIASTAICGGNDFWECPWLQGAHASAGAAWFYLLCWLLCMCGYQLVHTSNLVTINHLHHHHHHHHRHREDSMSDSESDDETLDQEAPPPASTKMTAEELLGTDDPIIHRAVESRAEAIREFAVSQRMDEIGETDVMEDFLEEEEIESQALDIEASISTPKASNVVMEP